MSRSFGPAIIREDTDVNASRTDDSLRTLDSRPSDDGQLTGAELDEFLYRVAHDLRASVRALEHLPDWIVEDLEADGVRISESPRRSLAFISSHARRLEHILTGLMDFARCGRAQMAVDQAPREVLEAVVADLAPPEGVTVENELADGSIHIGQTDLAQIFHVLVSNAIRFCPERPTTIRVTGQPAGASWEIAVIDEGPGIAAEHREAAFRPLVKLVSRDRDEGAGMGLAVLARIVARTGGRAWIEAGPEGRGTAVHLRLGA